MVLGISASGLVAADITLTRGGGTGCKIVIADQAPPQVRHAAAELARYIKEISGATMTIHTDREDIKTQVICVGPSRIADERLVEVDVTKLGREGFTITTGHSALAIIGGQPRGTLYGVYSFLEDELRCRWFTPDCSRIPQRPSIAIRSPNRTVVPVLEYRSTDYPNSRDADWAVRNKINGTQTHLDAQRGGKIAYAHFVHTFDSILNPKTHFAEHPEYFSEIDGKRKDGQTQLCLTNPDVQRITNETVNRWIAEAPEATIFSVSQNDWRHWCQCSTCTALADREGSQAGPMLTLVNNTADAIRAEHPDKLISTLAYQYTRKPPKTIRPRENVTVRLCSIECCFAHPLTTTGDPENEKFADDIRGWSKICDRLYVWDYVINYSHSIMPFPNLYSLQPNINFFVDHGVKGLYEEACYFTKGGEFAELRTWIIAKTMWDPGYDTNRAIDEFLVGYYGRADGPLRRYINLLHNKVRKENHHFTIRTPPTSPAFSQQLIAESNELFDQAEAAVKSNPTQLHRVEVARLPLIYVQIAQAVDKLTRNADDTPAKKQITRWLDDFERVAKKEGITHVREHDKGRLDTWLKKMRDAIRPEASTSNDSARE
jgi:hypothetical protein